MRRFNHLQEKTRVVLHPGVILPNAEHDMNPSTPLAQGTKRNSCMFRSLARRPAGSLLPSTIKQHTAVWHSGPKYLVKLGDVGCPRIWNMGKSRSSTTTPAARALHPQIHWKRLARPHNAPKQSPAIIVCCSPAGAAA